MKNLLINLLLASSVPLILFSLFKGDLTPSQLEMPSGADSIVNVVTEAGTESDGFSEKKAQFMPKPVPVAETSPYSFGNPAGCSVSAPNLSSEEMLAKVQRELGDTLNLAEHRMNYIWNGPLNTMMEVGNDPFVYEFSVNTFERPFTYKADVTATTFLTNGFVVWFRQYGNNFRLLAIPMVPGVLESPWAGYVTAYWQKDGVPNDEHIFPVTKKLPCHWVVDQGFVSDEALQETFNFDWHMPDYLTAGRQYLASNCKDANRISQEEIGYWDAASMCGPLAWTLIKDANAYPYRTGNWYADAMIFTDANPKWNGRPWAGFDPETYTVFHTETPMPGYDFEHNGNLYPGDIIYSYSTLYQSNDERFDHIFLVAGIDENNARVSITNMVRNIPTFDCFISEVNLYTPGDRVNGVINNEWNSREFGRTGVMGFDVFRWAWETYHLEGQARAYTVRLGETLETIAFDWKISPESIVSTNRLNLHDPLVSGMTILLPVPEVQFK